MTDDLFLIKGLISSAKHYTDSLYWTTKYLHQQHQMGIPAKIRMGLCGYPAVFVAADFDIHKLRNRATANAILATMEPEGSWYSASRTGCPKLLFGKPLYTGPLGTSPPLGLEFSLRTEEEFIAYLDTLAKPFKDFIEVNDAKIS